VFDFAQTYKRKREGDNLVTLTIDQLDRAIECSIYPTLQERLGDVTKIFFDIEGYEQKTEEPSRQELWDVTRKAVDYVCKPFYQDEHFDRRLVAVATRHRWSVVCEKYKFSVRVYMPYSAARSSIPAIMTFFGLERSIPDTCLEIDMSVYKSGEQLLGCVGCGKPGAELCVLKKWKDGGLVEDLPTSAYLAQDVSDVLRHLDMPSQQASEAELKEVVPTQYDTSPEGDMLRRLVFMVDPKLADDRMTWIQMGLALRSAGDDKLEVWKEWSRQSRKYDEGCCEKEWSSFNPTRVTMGTVHYLAKKHSPEEYAAWLRRKNRATLIGLRSMTTQTPPRSCSSS
jgi:hypothetical protein